MIDKLQAFLRYDWVEQASLCCLISSCVSERNVDETRFRTVLLIAFKVDKGAAMLEVTDLVIVGTWKSKNQNQDRLELLWAGYGRLYRRSTAQRGSYSLLLTCCGLQRSQWVTFIA